MQWYTDFTKRLFDILISLTALIILLPVLLFITVALFVYQEGNPFFLQKRPGKNEHVFTILKFKTMNDDRDENGNLLPDEKRITAFGAFIRKTSFDELLQLLNVLKGDMSLIGPRPLLVQYLPLYDSFQKQRHLVKPGITGWAQINGRNAISWQQKFELDVWYAHHVSFKLDALIVWKTIFKVFRQQDINQQGEATMPFFTGTN